jgi:hypothetical protein
MYGWEGFYDGFTTEPHKVFELPLVGGELWQGGTPDILRRWDMIVGLEHEPTDRIQARLRLGGTYIWHPIDDFEVVDSNALRDIALLVADRVELGAKVLVHCSAGLNRSGVVNARALMWMDHTAEEAISRVRKNRYQTVLCNPRFVRWLQQEQSVYGLADAS